MKTCPMHAMINDNNQRTNPDEPVMTRLKTSTASIHDAVEATPFALAIAAGRLPVERYVAQLDCLATIHYALETWFETTEAEGVGEVWQTLLAKRHLIDQDLAFWQARGVVAQTPPQARRATGALVTALLTWAGRKPVTMLGALYVLEGSTLGGVVIRRELQRSLGVGEEGLKYYHPYATNGEHGRMWKSFKQRMNATVCSPTDKAMVCMAAQRTFEGFADIWRALGDGLETVPAALHSLAS